MQLLFSQPIQYPIAFSSASQETLQKNPSLFTHVKTVKTKREKGKMFFLTLQCFLFRTKDSILKFFKEHLFYRPGYRSFEIQYVDDVYLQDFMTRKLTLKLFFTTPSKVRNVYT